VTLEVSSVDLSQAPKTNGKHTVYAAYNEDGFAKTFTRTVYVADNTASPLKSGIYTVNLPTIA